MTSERYPVYAPGHVGTVTGSMSSTPSPAMPQMGACAEQLEAATFDVINAWQVFIDIPTESGRPPVAGDKLMRISDCISLLSNLAADIRGRA